MLGYLFSEFYEDNLFSFYTANSLFVKRIHKALAPEVTREAGSDRVGNGLGINKVFCLLVNVNV